MSISVAEDLLHEDNTLASRLNRPSLAQRRSTQCMASRGFLGGDSLIKHAAEAHSVSYLQPGRRRADHWRFACITRLGSGCIGPWEC